MKRSLSQQRVGSSPSNKNIGNKGSKNAKEVKVQPKEKIKTK
jgi:hypothetical protein